MTELVSKIARTKSPAFTILEPIYIQERDLKLMHFKLSFAVSRILGKKIYIVSIFIV